MVVGAMVNRPNAVLVINPPNGDQGFLLPQLTSTQRLSIGPSSPQDDGLMVFDLTDKSFYHWNSGTWIKGLGSQALQDLSYDPATQKLSISGGSVIDLSALKEIPSTTGNGGKYLTTNGTTLSWANISSLGDITGIITGSTSALTGGTTTGDATLSVNTDGTTISVNGSNQLQLSNGAVTTSKLSNNAVNSTHIIDGSVTGADLLDNSVSTNDLANAAITSPKIGPGAVNPTHISSGGNDKVLSTDAGGVVTWIDKSTLVDDNQNLSLLTNILSIDNGTPVNLNNVTTGGDLGGTLNGLVIQPNAVNSVKVLDGSIATNDLAPGGANKVLTTNGGNVVTWADRSTFTDNQTLTFAGNTLSIQNGNAVNFTTAGQVTGLLDNLAITPGAANQVMVSNPTGTATQWVTPAGDVTGTVTASTVGKIQGRNVSNAAPSIGDALIWDGTAWVPTAIPGVTPTTSFLSIDPSAFAGLQVDNKTDHPTGLMESNNGTFVFAMGDAREIMAPVSLPDGATIQSISVYYEYSLLLGTFQITLSRKSLAGGAPQILTTINTPLIGLGVVNATNAVASVVDNSIYTYRVHVDFTNLINANTPGGALQRIYGVKIQYLK